MIIIPEKYDIVLTFSPIEEITGHWFEVFEYYWFLKKNSFHPVMLFNSPGISQQCVFSALRGKYRVDFDEDDVIVVHEIERLIMAPRAIILLCDGNFASLLQHHIKIIGRKIFGFACGSVSLPVDDYSNALYLGDQRIYGYLPYMIDYPKKIYSDILRYPDTTPNDNAMLYLTSNCRRFSRCDFIHMMDEVDIKGDFIVLTYDTNEYVGLPRTIPMKPPVDKIFDLFGTYIYTPIPRKFDCSPRFIAECQIFGKDVIYYDIDYHDAGLQTRIQDIENNICWLKDNDPIISIFRECIT